MMKTDTKIALKKAVELSMMVYNNSLGGNEEGAHRLSVVYTSLLLTALVHEMIPGSAEYMQRIESTLVPKKTKDGTVIN